MNAGTDLKYKEGPQVKYSAKEFFQGKKEKEKKAARLLSRSTS